MTIALQEQGWAVNPKRTRRLMRRMGLEAIYPKPRLSGNGSAHPRFPYLLNGLAIERSNQVWCSDITYIGLAGGFVYLFALMDWFSRFVLAWELSNSLESDFCVRALRRALRTYGAPQISNTDQGEQEIVGGQSFVRELSGASPMINESGLPPPFKSVVACRPPGISRSPR
jgi:putative transposase